YYDKTEQVAETYEIQHELIREAMVIAGVNGGVDIAILSDVPTQGTGLGSSSTLTVGLLTALYEYQGINVDIEDIARQACNIEINILGNPIGKQDQYAAAYGGLNIFRFLEDESVLIEPILITETLRRDFFKQLFMVNTGMSRSAGEILKKVKEDMSSNIENLKEMAQMPDIFKIALREDNLDMAAECLLHAWDLKKKVGSRVTNTAIDIIYNNGLKAGATAGKLLGAGAGGFMLFLVPVPEQERFLSEMSKKYEILPVNYSDKGSSILYCFNNNY
ncbi:MAG: GHMP kinase, partial [Firmicutes bacterium]|nr:GHMP kinase [Bacillota bacterium]